MTPEQRLARRRPLQEIAVARPWALIEPSAVTDPIARVERSAVTDPIARVELVIRARYPECSDAEVDGLLLAIRTAEEPKAWLERLRVRAAEITERLRSE